MKGKLLRALEGEKFSVPPIWLMRQAGRYLSEYRALREKAGGFLDLCYTPELAVEATLQPIRRFDFDAAIIFSDILVIPDALGRKVEFSEGIGPRLVPAGESDIAELEGRSVLPALEPVLTAIRQTRERLDAGKALLGFCGAPWTVATYMIAGEASVDQAPARRFAYSQPEAFSRLIDVLVEASAEYLTAQLAAGADAVQIFDSWSGALDEHEFRKWCLAPASAIVSRVKKARPGARIIGFPKGAANHYPDYRQATGVDAVGLDWTVPLDLAARLQKDGPVQGNLDPLRLAVGGRALDEGVEAILEKLTSGPFIFNLGHGITPDTPIENVERMVRRVRGEHL